MVCVLLFYCLFFKTTLLPFRVESRLNILSYLIKVEEKSLYISCPPHTLFLRLYCVCCCYYLYIYTSQYSYRYYFGVFLNIILCQIIIFWAEDLSNIDYLSHKNRGKIYVHFILFGSYLWDYIKYIIIVIYYILLIKGQNSNFPIFFVFNHHVKMSVLQRVQQTNNFNKDKTCNYIY